MVNSAAPQSDSVLDDAEPLLQMARVGGKLGWLAHCAIAHTCSTRFVASPIWA
jgi:hypothetical protein